MDSRVCEIAVDWAGLVGYGFIETVEKVGVVIECHLVVVVGVVGIVLVLRGLASVLTLIGYSFAGRDVFASARVE